MFSNYLFPYEFKLVGKIILIPSLLVGFFSLVMDFEPSIFLVKVPAVFVNPIFGEKQLFGVVQNNIWNEILAILIIVGSLLVAFSKEKQEDEYISRLRLESLVWAVYCNYGILLLALLFIYGLSFFNVMMLNIFTILLFFIIRFNWQLIKLNKSASYEK